MGELNINNYCGKTFEFLDPAGPKPILTSIKEGLENICKKFYKIWKSPRNVVREYGDLAAAVGAGIVIGDPNILNSIPKNLVDIICGCSYTAPWVLAFSPKDDPYKRGRNMTAFMAAMLGFNKLIYHVSGPKLHYAEVMGYSCCSAVFEFARLRERQDKQKKSEFFVIVPKYFS